MMIFNHYVVFISSLLWPSDSRLPRMGEDWTGAGGNHKIAKPTKITRPWEHPRKGKTTTNTTTLPSPPPRVAERMSPGSGVAPRPVRVPLTGDTKTPMASELPITLKFFRLDPSYFGQETIKKILMTRPRTTRPSYPTPNRGVGEVDPTNPEDSSPAPRNQCGVDTQGDRIYGGQITELDEFPWMALLGYLTTKGTTTYQCGGVLFNQRYVLTAAHCLTGAIEKEVGTLKTVRLGEYDTQSDRDCLNKECADPPQEIAVLGIYPHEGYNDQNKNRKDDIGLIRLAKRATYSYYVQPICLVEPNSRLNSGNDVFVAGWGKTLNGRNSNVKLKLNIPIFDKDDCVSKYRRLGVELTEIQICAGGVFAEDACRGDSGGPLMIRKPQGIWESLAVVSFGYGCGRDGWPGVYTSVADYLDWIHSTLQSTNQ